MSKIDFSLSQIWHSKYVLPVHYHATLSTGIPKRHFQTPDAPEDRNPNRLKQWLAPFL
jgi:hypothetical protein